MGSHVLILALHDRILPNNHHQVHIHRNENLILLFVLPTYSGQSTYPEIVPLFINELVLVVDLPLSNTYTYMYTICMQYQSEFNYKCQELYKYIIITCQRPFKYSIDILIKQMNYPRQSIYSQPMTPNQHSHSPAHSLSSSRQSLSSNNRSFKRKVQKFTFRHLDLAYQVRQRVYELLINFDDNSNFELEEVEIKKALVQILNQTPEQLIYVTKNVFRYDHNNDGMITYEQFTNFCLEQHFGEMAIQRLHKIGTYAKGKERVMSKKQFYQTLVYCLKFINVTPNEEAVYQIFQDVDKKGIGQITYSEYFVFLKQYFGSKSQSAQRININDIKQNCGNNTDGSDGQLWRKKNNEQEDNYEKRRKEREIEEGIKRNAEQQRKRRQEEDRKKRQQQERKRRQDDDRRRRQGQERDRRQEDERKRKRQQEQLQRKRKLEEQALKRQRENEQMTKRRQSLTSRNNQNNISTNLTNLGNLTNKNEQLISLTQRISRLVYHQLKITIMDNDRQFLLCTDKSIASQLLKNNLQISHENSSKIIDKYFMNKVTVSYEEVLKASVEEHMTQIYPDMICRKYPLNRQSFIDEVMNALHFIKAKPLTHTLQGLYDQSMKGSGLKDMDQRKFKEVMRMVFANYKWPRATGEQRTPLKSMKNSNYYPIKTDRF